MNDEDDELDRSRPYSTYFDSSAVHHSINPDCPVCSKPVFWSRHISWLNRVWHVQCFICSYCYKPLKPGEQSFHGGKIYCTDVCFNELFLGHVADSQAANRTADRQTETLATNRMDNPKDQQTDHKQMDPKQTDNNRTDNRTEKQTDNRTDNRTDNDRIDQQTKAENNRCSWAARADHHRPCLHCVKCDHLIVNHRRLTENYPHSKFPSYRENVELHQAANEGRTSDRRPNRTLNRSVQASDFIGRRCVRCSRRVFAAELSPSINFPYHLNCLRCSICDRPLQPAAHAVHDGLPICQFPCYNRIFNAYPYRKGWQECRP